MKMLDVITPICCGPDTPTLSPDAARDLAGRFRALADPTRVAIVNRLAAAPEVCVCDLTAAFDLSQPTISHHLRILRDQHEAVQRRIGDILRGHADTLRKPGDGIVFRRFEVHSDRAHGAPFLLGG